MTVAKRASAVITAGLIVGVIAGAALGVLWVALAPRVSLVVTPGSSRVDEFQPEGYLAADVAFGALAIVAGVLVTIGLAYMRREHLGSVLVAALLASAVGTAAMWFVGTHLGGVDLEGLLDGSEGEIVVDAPLQVSMPGMFLMWSLAASVVVSILAISDWLAARGQGTSV